MSKVQFRLTNAIKVICVAIVATILFMPWFALNTSADSNIYLTLEGPSDEIHAGDVATVTVRASELKHITRFGPIDLAYNSDSLELVSIWPVTELSAFTFTVDDLTNGHFIVSAVDQAVEADIAANQLSGNQEDPSIYIDSEVVLFTLSFRVISSSSANIRFWIDSAGGFRDSSMNEIESTIGDGITVQVAPSLSDDAFLTELSIEESSISPEFSPDTFEYSASVSRDVSDVTINAIPGNIWADVEILNSTNLSFGENVVTIVVTAQDGQTVYEYKIYINRQDVSVAGGSSFIDAFGKSYTFIDLPMSVDIPDGFELETRTINGYIVDVYAMPGLSSVLVYAYDGESEPSFFFFNPLTRIATRYNSRDCFIMPSRVLSVAKIPDIVKIPEGFIEGSIVVDGIEISGYQNVDGVFIAYLRDEEGSAEFYQYDETTGRFVDYKTVEKTSEKMYKILFHVFMGLTALEAILIIVIVCIIRKVIIVRANPKPRRV